MKARQWKITRQLVTRPDAQRRWDQAYQSLLRWTNTPTQPTVAEPRQEETDADRRVRPSLYPAASPSADH